MKKALALLLSTSMIAAMIIGCTPAPKTPDATKAPEATKGAEATPEPKPEETEGPKKPVELNVITTYSTEDGNRLNYEAAFKAYEAASGNKINDASATANEEQKAKVMTDFQTGSEPDILFYYNGVDSNKIIEANKVVSIDEIRSVYPDYASNMKDSMLGASPVDGKNYSVPVNGFWEGLFVNKKVLADCGIAVPGADYTWEKFMADCEVIKAKGYTPVAVSFQEVPHYWFEFTVFNHGNSANHIDLPQAAGDPVAAKWVKGLTNMKEMYDKGYVPKNTLTATDPDTFQLMADNKAAFAIDGSWKVGWFQENAADINDFTVTYVPGAGERKATDIIGGLSMGYYITRKAWENPEKQKACVDFVSAMTTDEVVSTFGATAITALKNGTMPPAESDALMDAAMVMTKGATSISAPVQDFLTAEARGDLFANIKNVVAGKITAEDAVSSAIALNK